MFVVTNRVPTIYVVTCRTCIIIHFYSSYISLILCLCIPVFLHNILTNVFIFL